MEKNYEISDKEGLSIVFGVKHFKPYLHGSHFVVQTDHASLRALIKSKELIGLLAKWAIILQSYDNKIVYKPRWLHKNVDAFSRSAPTIT
jgi:hypothetical protein